MARRRYFRPQDNVRRGPRINDWIRISPIRLIDENNQMIGVVETSEALRRAREAGLDLVEVAPESKPPVCRILDFGKFKYEQSKKEKAQRANSKTAAMKEVRLGRSMKIDPHDIRIRLDRARKFLLAGHKVQIVQNFRGREMMHRQRGHDRMRDIIEELSEVAKVEVPPRLNGRRMTMIFAPDKVKVEQIKRKLAEEGIDIEAELANDPEVADDTVAESASEEADEPTAAVESDDLDDITADIPGLTIETPKELATD